MTQTNPAQGLGWSTVALHGWSDPHFAPQIKIARQPDWSVTLAQKWNIPWCNPAWSTKIFVASFSSFQSQSITIRCPWTLQLAINKALITSWSPLCWTRAPGPIHHETGAWQSCESQAMFGCCKATTSAQTILTMFALHLHRIILDHLADTSAYDVPLANIS